jgi:hypothetical protein
VLDHGSHIGSAVVQVDPVQRAAASPDAARLRPQHPIARIRETLRDRIEIGRAAAKRRQQNNDGSASLRQNLDADVIPLDDDWTQCSHRFPHTVIHLAMPFAPPATDQPSRRAARRNAIAPVIRHSAARFGRGQSR